MNKYSNFNVRRRDKTFIENEAMHERLLMCCNHQIEQATKSLALAYFERGLEHMEADNLRLALSDFAKANTLSPENTLYVSSIKIIECRIDRVKRRYRP